MTREIKVSIVVPIYNQEKYLNISLPSVIGQSYRNIEIVLVNDGSTDNSIQIIREFEKHDRRIIVLEKENGGLVDATIYGLEHVSGDYVCFLDPDDRIGQDYIETFVSNIVGEEDFIAAGFFYEKSDEIIPYHLNADKEYHEQDIQKLQSTYLFDQRNHGISNEIFISRWNKMYSMACLQQIIAQFKKCKNVSLGEDTIFTFLMLQYSRYGKTLKQPNSYYYNIANQASMMNQNKMFVYLEKCKIAYNCFTLILNENGKDNNLALELYYLLTDRIYQLQEHDLKKFVLTYKVLRQDKSYNSSLKHIFKKSETMKQKLSAGMRYYVKSGLIYYGVNSLKNIVKAILNK